MTDIIRSGKKQGGVMLLEALIAILIFSLGILAVVGMQASAVKSVTDSRARSEAAHLANKLMAQVWIDAGNVAGYAYTGSGAIPARLQDWVTEVNAKLPSAAATPPTVTLIDAATAQGATLEIRLFWRHPEEAAQNLPPHSYVLRAAVFTS